VVFLGGGEIFSFFFSGALGYTSFQGLSYFRAQAAPLDLLNFAGLPLVFYSFLPEEITDKVEK